MSQTINARGLSCPQPVLMTLKAIKQTDTGRLVVLVDTDTAKENVSRAAAGQKWEVENIETDGDGYSLTLRKD